MLCELRLSELHARLILFHVDFFILFSGLMYAFSPLTVDLPGCLSTFLSALVCFRFASLHTETMLMIGSMRFYGLAFKCNFSVNVVYFMRLFPMYNILSLGIVGSCTPK